MKLTYMRTSTVTSYIKKDVIIQCDFLHCVSTRQNSVIFL